MSEAQRKENEKWLRAGAERDPDGWEAALIKRYGMTGILNLYEATEVNASVLDLRRVPFSYSPELKRLAIRARAAHADLTRAIYEEIWSDL